MDASITFLNMSGDITVTWDPKNAEKIKALIKKKMAEGYSFFTTKATASIFSPKPTIRKVSAKNVDEVENLFIDDKTFEKMVSEIADEDVAQAVRGNEVKVDRKKSIRQRQMDTVKRLKDPDEVIKEKTVAVKPIVGG